MKNQGRRLLKNCTPDEIIAYAKSLGFTLTADDCAWMELPMWMRDDKETLAHAVKDYLLACEGHA